MNAVASPTSAPPHKGLTRRQSVGLMFLCTLLGAAGQVLIKQGANGLSAHGWSMGTLWAMATNFNLVAGYGLYGLMTVLFVWALRHEELSILYPIIALTYVWVAVLSVWLFRETVHPAKLAGILIIVAGVGVLGRNGAGK